jgi:hypothetical protein
MIEIPLRGDPQSGAGLTPTRRSRPVVGEPVGPMVGGTDGRRDRWSEGPTVGGTDGSTLEMTPPACLDLLRTEEVGRLGVVWRGRPEIFPFNYALDASDSVILRTASGNKLMAAANNPVVFEVDRYDRETQEGWSVIIHAVAHRTQRVEPGEQPMRTGQTGTTHLLRLSTTAISGRRIGPVGSPWHTSVH